MSTTAVATPPIHEPRGLGDSPFRLDGKVAVVSGGSKNIGLEIAAAFLQSGASVIITGRKLAQLDAAKAGLLRLVPDGRVEAVEADLAVPGGSDRVAELVEREFGFVDVLVNCAHLTGDTREKNPLDIDRGTWMQVYETNLFGPLELMNRLILPVHQAGRSASVINVLSGAAFQVVPGLPAYCSSKAALWMLTKSLAAGLGPHIRVNAVCPGVVTEDGKPRFAYGAKLLAEGGIPLGRIGAPEEVSGAALYLASDSSSYSSGSVIHCNGGRPW